MIIRITSLTTCSRFMVLWSSLSGGRSCSLVSAMGSSLFPHLILVFRLSVALRIVEEALLFHFKVIESHFALYKTLTPLKESISLSWIRLTLALPLFSFSVSASSQSRASSIIRGLRRCLKSKALPSIVIDDQTVSEWVLDIIGFKSNFQYWTASKTNVTKIEIGDEAKYEYWIMLQILVRIFPFSEWASSIWMRLY